MKISVILKSFLLSLLFILFSLSLLHLNSSNAEAVPGGQNPGHYTKIDFEDSNWGTTWEVYARYFSQCCGNTAWSYYETAGDGRPGVDLIISDFRGREGDKVKWLTACVDPVVNVGAIDRTTWNVRVCFPIIGCFTLINGTISEGSVDVTCYRGAGGIYAACDAPNGHGFIRFNQICPGTPDCATRGLLELCNAGTRTCGTGVNRCDRVEQRCNFSNSFGNWCVSAVINRDVEGCLGVDGCCLSNTDCKNGSYYCGSGSISEVCTRYRNVCGDNQKCAVRTVNTESQYCADNTYWACTSDAECGDRYCRNPNPCGMCTDYDQLAGRVFVDYNRNNSWDSGTDTPLANATVQRKPVSGDWPTSSSSNNWITTNSNGYYIFDQLKNPSNQDVRIRPEEFGLYDSNHCTYTNIIRSKYLGNVQDSPGHRRNNIDPTPNLSGVLFMLRYNQYSGGATVWEDTNYNGSLDSGDARHANSNVVVRINDADTGDFLANDNVYAGSDSSRWGNVWFPDVLVDKKTYIIALNRSTLQTGWDMAGGDSNKKNITVNCATPDRVNFLVTDNPPPLPDEPELNISTFNVPDSVVGTSNTGTMRINNDGKTGTGVGFSIRISNGAGATTTVNTSALGSGAYRDISFSLSTPGTANTYTATATIDSGNVIAEADETNNTASTNYEAYNLGEEPSSEGGGIDLVIDSFTIPSADINTTSDGSITVRNTGTESTSSGFSISINNGNGNILTVGSAAISAGASATINFTINVPGTEDIYTASATVDSGNLITEINESNNFANTAYEATYTPPTYHIRGGVFLDSMDAQQNWDGIKSSTEPYTSGSQGTLNIATVGDRSGAFDVEVLEDDYTITYNLANLPTGWIITYPPYLSPNNPFVRVHPGDPLQNKCSTLTHLHAECDPATGDVNNVNFGIMQRPADPWFKGIGGDMRSDATLVNRIPNAAGDYFSDRSGNFPTGGVVFGNFDLTPITGEAPRVSYNRNWLIRNNFSGTLNFSYSGMQNLLNKNGVWTTASALSGVCTTSSCTLPAGLSSGIYTSGALTLTGGDYQLPAGVDVVFMINGNLRIENDITIPANSGSTAIFIVNGDIYVSPDVENLHGIYSAVGDFTVDAETGATPDPVLTIQGSVIANSTGTDPGATFINERNLYIGNETEPSVIIQYRPDFVLNAPPYIKFSNYSIKEVAPGSQ